MYQFKDRYVLNFTNVDHYLEIHNVIKKSLDFPDYYGHNWSALWDCLTDMIGRPINIEIHGIDRLEQQREDDAKKLIEILKKFKHYDDDRYANEIKITLVIDGQTCDLP